MNACHLLAVQAMDLRMTRRQCIIIHIPHIAYIRSVLIQTIANTHRRYECIYICSICDVYWLLLLCVSVPIINDIIRLGGPLFLSFTVRQCCLYVLLFFYLFSSIQYIRPFELCCVYATNTLPLKRSGLPTNARTLIHHHTYIIKYILYAFLVIIEFYVNAIPFSWFCPVAAGIYNILRQSQQPLHHIE